MRHRLLLGATLVFLLVSPAYGAPNLTATVDMDIEYGAAEALVTFSFTFENTGSSFCDASIFWADFWGAYTCQCDTNPMFCGTAPVSDKTWEFTDPAILGPGTVWSPDEPVIRAYQYSEEPYRFMLFVDSLFSCNEGGEEDDNMICGEFTINPVTKEPDLEITNCTLEQDPDFPAGILFTATVRNVGENATELGTDVDFFMLTDPNDQAVDKVWGDVGADFASVPAGIAPEGEVVVTSNLSQCAPSWYYPIFTVNGFEVFDEPDYDNNWCVPDPPLYECTFNVLKPDLVISEFSVDQEILDTQGLIRLQGKVKNQGLLAITSQESFKLCIYEDWPQKPQDCEVPEHGVDGWILSFENGLGPALDEEFDKISETATAGLHTYWLRVDCDCVDPEYGEILESDEKNNEAKLDDVLIPVEGPDLVVSTFLAPTLSMPGENVIHYIVEITNIGTEPISADIEVDLFRDYPGADKPTFAGVLAAIDAGEEWPENAEFFAIPGGLGANGGHAQAEFTDWAPKEDGNYTPWVIVDIIDGVLEANEENNAATIDGGVDYIAKPPTEGPNLAIEKFTGKVEGNRITYDIMVRNNGDDVATGPFRLDLFTDRESPPNLFEWSNIFITVDDLQPGDAAPWTYQWEDVDEGIYRSYILADTDNVVAEINEGDNLAGFLLFEVGTVLCEEGEIVQDGCLCGDEPQFTGYCCDNEWSAVPCAPVVVEARVEEDGDVVEGEDPTTTFGGAGDGCGCRQAPADGLPVGPAMILALLAALVLVLRSRSPRGTPAARRRG